MNLLRPLEKLLNRLGYARVEKVADVDKTLIPPIEHIAKREGLSISDTVNQLLHFAVDEQQLADDNLTFWETLTDREKEATALTCLGYTNHEIAQKMTISPNTVKTHLRNILQKFEINSKAELQVLLASWDFCAWDNPDLGKTSDAAPK